MFRRGFSSSSWLRCPVLNKHAVATSGGVSKNVSASTQDAQITKGEGQEGLATTAAESAHSVNEIPEDPNVITPQRVQPTTPYENVAIEFQKLVHRMGQVGPYLESHRQDEPQHGVALRKRRESFSVAPIKPVYQPLETSFRRLPAGAKIPIEGELRCMYPMQTSLQFNVYDADCVHYNFQEHGEDPLPVRYVKMLPPNYNPEKEHPFMVVVPDHRGMEEDFEDVCFHWFERQNVYPGIVEGGWVILCPILNVKHSTTHPVEAVLAHFCDHVTKTYKVEGNRVHLFGKGLGGHLIMRTILDFKDVARSVVALPGRLGAPLRLAERPYEKAVNATGVHTLIYVPGSVFKTDWIYKFKILLESSQVRPPPRFVHFADVRDHQIYYAINPVEFWNYMNYFRTAHHVAATPPLWR
eukprot:PhM_4_TR10993/c0_g1_i1/m.29149